MRITKKRKQVQARLDAKKQYSLQEASDLVCQLSTTTFDGAVDMHLRLGVDPTKADQLVRGTLTLPNGLGKTKSVLVLCPPEKEEEAKNAGADFFGFDEYLQKIESGWTSVDVVIATPAVMPKLGKLGKILGPRNLMPNPRSGTVTNDVAAAVKDVKAGKVAFKVDKAGIVHCSVGRVSFSGQKIYENAKELVSTVVRLRPSSVKGTYIKSAFLAPSMGPGVPVDLSSL